MTTVVQVCNMALAHVGQPRINDIEESEHCNLFYEEVRDGELELFNYTFGLRRQVLAQLGTNPLSKVWDYAYQVPSDVKTLIGLTTSDGYQFDPPIRFAREGTTIYTDQKDASAIYAADSTDPAEWSAKFREALAYKLASKIAIPLTQEASFAEWAERSYMKCISEARAHSIRAEDHAQTYTRQPASLLFKTGIYSNEWVAIRGDV